MGSEPQPTLESSERRPRENSPDRLDSLQRTVNALLDRVAELERFKTEQAQFVFQTVAVVITLLALTIGLPVAVVTRLQLGSALAVDVIAGLLAGILILLGAWVLMWHRAHFRPRRRVGSRR